MIGKGGPETSTSMASTFLSGDETTLVVGASGATGRLLVGELLKAGQKVKVIVRPTSSFPEVWNNHDHRSEEHTSELKSLMRISYAVFCLKKKTTTTIFTSTTYLFIHQRI